MSGSYAGLYFFVCTSISLVLKEGHIFLFIVLYNIISIILYKTDLKFNIYAK